MSARLWLLVGLALATALFACAGGSADEEELGVARASVAIGRSDPDRVPDRVVLVSIAGLQSTFLRV